MNFDRTEEQKMIKEMSRDFSDEVIRILQRVAQREIEAIEWEKKSLQVLSGSGSGRMALLFYAIREEVISIRLDNLFHIITLLDASGIVASAISSISHTDPHVRARGLEILENTGDEKINRMIIHTIEWLDTLQPHPEENGMLAQKKEEMVAATYSVSHNEWVAFCADYACSAPEKA